MGRPKGIPSYRNHSSGQARVEIDGRTHYLGPHGSPDSRAKYDRLVAEWLAAGRQATPPEPELAPAPNPTTTTVTGVVLAFWSHAEQHYRAPDGTPSEELGNIKAALKPLRLLYGPTLAADFGPVALRAVREQMVRDGLARGTVNSRVNRIRRAFKWAASVELVPASVVVALGTLAGLQKGRTAARETAPVGPVALEVVEATLPQLSRPVAGLVRFQLLTGARPREACLVRGCDVVEGPDGWTYTPATHKTAHHGRSRPIPLGPQAVALMEEYRRTDPAAYLFDPRDTPGAPTAKRNDRYSRAAYLNMITRACDRAFPHPTLKRKRGEKFTAEQAAELLAWRKAHRWHPNQLRHTAATLIRARYGLEAAQVVLGHSRADVTQVYAERDLARAREVMREIG